MANSLIAMSDEAVVCYGEALHPQWWRGRQWAVTEYGVECLDGRYHIEKDRLLENLPRFSWPEHMAGKIWVDVDDFATAWDGRIGPSRVFGSDQFR